MRLKPRLTSLLASIFIIGVAGLSSLTRKAVAMERVSEPVVTQMLVKQQDISSSEKPVGVGITAAEEIPGNITAIETPETASATISSYSGLTQTLAGGLPLAGSMSTQQSAPLRHSDGSAKSLPSRGSTPLSGQMGQQQRIGSGPSTPSTGRAGVQGSVQSELFLGSSNTRLSGASKKSSRRPFDCCGYPIFAGKKSFYFDLATATEKREDWNVAIADGVRDIHKPRSLEENLHNHPKEMFNSSDTETNPLYVFAREDETRIVNHVRELATLEPGRSGATLSDTKKIIFCDTISKGKYIEAFTFIDNYTKPETSARDSRNHKLNVMALKNKDDEVFFEGLVCPETAKQHLPTNHTKSSTHADAYMPKGKGWGNIGDISNHTGIARAPKNASKLKRDATYKR